MNELEELKKITHYVLDLHQRGTTDSADAPYQHPTWTYTDAVSYTHLRAHET